MDSPLGIGLIGCGNISEAYFKGLQPFAGIAKIRVCADQDARRAREKATAHAIRHATVKDLLADPRVDIVLNLTIPKAHREVNLQALGAGKHVYCEKPLDLGTPGAREVLALAKRMKLRVGCAPDTFLGSAIQNARRRVDEGAIGRPLSAMAFMLCRGHESWHPNPAFYYQTGGGPMFDMGPYYLTALVNLLGPVSRVCASTQTGFTERIITSEPLAGQRIVVETPTHLAGVIDFHDGPSATVVMSFDSYPARVPPLTLFGTEGTLELADPNHFAGGIFLRTGKGDFSALPCDFPENIGRGVGLAEMAQAILEERPHRASGEMALHVVEVMESFERSSVMGRHVRPRSACLRPEPLDPHFIPSTS